MSPPTRRWTSATSDTYIDIETPAFGATFSAPGMWLIAYSMYGRVSSTTALLSATMRFISSVLISGVFWFASWSVP